MHLRDKRLRGRMGKAAGVPAIILFLLGMMAAFPLLSWTFREEPAAASKPPDTYAIDIGQLETQDLSRLLEMRPKLKDWHYVADLDLELAQFESVFWEPEDTDSLRAWLAHSVDLSSQRILEIGTGTGLVAIACLLENAESVVATDINPLACLNARYNAEQMGLSDRLKVRLVAPSDPGPFSVVAAEESFDLIISNPPWEDASVPELAAHALYDPGFQLLDALLAQSADYLNDGGKLLLAYGAKQAIERILRMGPDLGWQVELADERQLDELPEVFVPGMLLVLSPEK